jgi:hypothetical protein
VVIVADAPGKLPKQLREQRAALGGVVSRTWLIPWVPQWRTAAPSPDTAPAELARLGRDLQSTPWISPKGQ